MDWSRLIGQFPQVNGDEVPYFAAPRETEQAIASFNKAVFNLQHNNADIALIGLIKLTATFPLFAQA